MDLKKNVFSRNEDFEKLQIEIKEHLKNTVPEGIYDIWVDNFVFEKINSDVVVAGYYGDQPIKNFNKEYKKVVLDEISSFLGYTKEFKVYKRSGGSSILNSPEMQKNIKTVKFFLVSMFFAFIALFFALIICNYIGNRNFRESFFNVSSLKIDGNIRVIQISDLHSCAYGKGNQKLIDRVQKLEPDLILCTGDIIDSGKDKTEDTLNLCSEISKVAPSYYIYGNNEAEKVYDFPLNKDALDKKFGFNDNNRVPEKLLELSDSLEEMLEKTGIKVLKNEFETIKIDAVDVDVFGVLTSNPSSFWQYTGDRFSEYIYSNPNNLKITAIHEPFVFEKFEEDFWGDLMVCGHTHGGVMRVPVLGPLYTHEGGLFPERSGDFVYGRYDTAGKPLIVSSGLENKNIFRINNQPELVIIDINKF